MPRIPLKREPKIIQIAICPDAYDPWPDLFALRDDGSVAYCAIQGNVKDGIIAAWHEIPVK